MHTHHRWTRCTGLVGGWLCALLAGPAIGQMPAGGTSRFYPDSNYRAEAQLRSADGHARAGQWAEAVDIYQRVIAEFPDTLVTLPKGDPSADPSGESKLFVDVRRHCQRRLAALPPEALAVYKARVDGQAERWFLDGRDRRDVALLRRVVEEAFCSSWGDDALELLGDLAFQDGRFAEALSAYRRLVPSKDEEGRGLAYPDPQVDKARVAAKALICRAAEGIDPPSAADLADYKALYAAATGPLAGRKGPLADSLALALSADKLALPAQLDGRWPTFGGSPTRSKVAPGPIDVGALQWRKRLPARPRPSSGYGMQRMGASTAERALPYHPIVVGDQVLVADETRVFAYNLSARPAPGAPGPPPPASSAPDEEDQADGIFAWESPRQQLQAGGGSGSPRHTLSAAGDRVFARLGPPGQRGAGSSKVVALRNNREVEGKLIWGRVASEVELPRRKPDGNRASAFEGTPVADERSVFVALTDWGTEVGSYVACLDAETGRPRWVRHLGVAQAPLDPNNGAPSTADVGQRLLSLDGPTVYYQTNLGALAALDAETGQIRWLATYPHRDRPDGGLVGGRPRDLNPAILHGGLAIVAPEDATHIYAFDAASGKLAWRSDREYASLSHVLGVAKGRLIATGDHVWSLDVRTGKFLRAWPDNPVGYRDAGRGILAGEQIYWPTRSPTDAPRSEIQVLDQATGMRGDREAIPLWSYGVEGGNLAAGDGYLVVAQAEELVVFCQNTRLIERYRQEIAAAPDRAAPRYLLGRVAEGLGQDSLALESLSAAERLARPGESVDGEPLGLAARDAQHRLLGVIGARQALAKDWAASATSYREASVLAIADRDRLSTGLKLAEVLEEGGEPAQAVSTLQGLLADEKALALCVEADPRKTRTVRADLLIADRLAGLIRAGGRGLYAEYDRRADELLRRGRVEGDPHLLEEVARRYPASAAVPGSLLALGRLHAEAGRPSQAARAHKRLLASAVDADQCASALWGLGQDYEAMKLYGPARDSYARIVARHPRARPAEPKGTATLGELAAARLATAPLSRLAADSAEPSMPVPLVRRWDAPIGGGARPLSASGVAPSPTAPRVFLAERDTLQPVDPVSGKAVWTAADLGGEVQWVAYLGDSVVAATPRRVVALDRSTGAVAWRYPAEAPAAPPPADHPLARAGFKGPSPASTRLDGFRVVGGRVFLIRGDRELVALDGDSGLVDWSYMPSAGEINPHYWVGDRRAALQVRSPNALVVLETDRGRGRELPAVEEEEPWARDPIPMDEDHVAVATDDQTVALLDLNRGAAAWSVPHRSVLPGGGPPRLLGDTGRLVVLYGGRELVRLDPANGRAAWAEPRPLGPEDLSECPEALALDAERVYAVGGDGPAASALMAVDLADGHVLWKRLLAGPAQGWSLSLTDRCVVAHPNPRRSVNPPADIPLVFCRRDTGALVQRLVFPAGAADLAVRLVPRGVLVATQAGLWGLGEAPPVDSRPPNR